MTDLFHVLPDPPKTSGKFSLEQFFTPEWSAEAIVEHFFPDLSASDTVIEPSCGPGAFLKAVPAHVNAYGVEIDPILAERARINTGREVLCGDFTAIGLPIAPTVILGNPPFQIQVVRNFLARAYDLLPQDGRCGFVLPAHAFQHAHTVADLNQKWGIEQHSIPRDMFPGLSVPIMFAMFSKERQRKLIGFALYDQANAVKRMAKPLRCILINGVERKTSWTALVEYVLTQLGGDAKLEQIYEAIEPLRHTSNQWWKEKVRQVLQRGPFERKSEGHWALAA